MTKEGRDFELVFGWDEKMATASIITGFVAVFCFHKCQTRDYNIKPKNMQVVFCLNAFATVHG